MRHLLTLPVIALVATFLVAGCGGGGSQGKQEDNHATSAAKLDLHPVGDSKASGSASFKDSSFKDGPDGVVVRLDLRGLPKPDTSYLAHIHPGTCAEEAEEHAHEQGEHPEEGEISYELSQVESNPEGRGWSTTAFGQIYVDKLFSGESRKHVMVHEAGSGNPPILACADLKRAG